MSIFSKIGSAIKNTATKAVSAVKNAVSKVSGSSQGASALQGSYISGSLGQATANAAARSAKDVKTYQTQTATAKSYIAPVSNYGTGTLSTDGLMNNYLSSTAPTTYSNTSKTIAPTSDSYTIGALAGTQNAFQTPLAPTVQSNLGSYLGSSALNSGSTVGTPGSALGSTLGAEAPMSALEMENKKREEETRKSQNDLIAMMNELAGKPQEAVRLEEQAGLPQANAELRDLQAKQTLQTAQYMQLQQDIQNKPIAMEFIAGQQGEVARRAGIDAMITSALIQSKTGQIETAQDTVDRALSMKYDPLIQRMDFQKQILEMNYNELSRSDKKLADERTAKLAIETKKLDQLMSFQNNAIKNAMQNGAPSSVISNIMNSNDVGQISQVGGGYIVSEADRLELEIQKLQKQKLSKEISSMGKASNKLLSVTEAQAAGVPFGTTEAQLIAQSGGVGTVDVKKAQASVANMQWLKDTATKANNLSKGAGRTGVHEFLANAFTLSQKKQLVGLSDSLRTNMLLMNTDPAVKKFFGPQMSEADVRMMTAGGTTLSPDTQTPELFKEEVGRIYDLVNRAQAAVKEGIQKEQLNSFVDSAGTALQVVNSPYLK